MQELQQLVESYQPDPAALQALEPVRLLMTVAPSGTGKTTLARASGLAMVLGDAARPPRKGEQDGVDYWFRSQTEMERDARARQYIQIAIGAGGDLKGTRASSFPQTGWAVFAVVAAAVPNFRSLPFAETKVAVIVPPDYETWMQRMDGHELDERAREARVKEAEHSYQFALADSEALFVLNDTVEAGARRLLQVVKGETPDRHDKARAIAVNILAQLSADRLP